MADNFAHPYNRRQGLSIDDLPDDVLLAIFDFYVVKYQRLGFVESGNYVSKRNMESWQSLVHVCRRWRGLVFGSPRRLNLQLCCIPGTSPRNSLGVWPALPLLIKGDLDVSETSVDNVIAELEHSDRIRQIDLDFCTTSQIEKLWTSMQVPFRELAVLFLSFVGLSRAPVLPDSFLGGPAPCLRFLALYAIPFPGLPKLLLSATHLVELYLCNIPHSGYFSPEAMATCLSMLTSLQALRLEFGYPQSSPDQESQRPPPPTRSVLPALTRFWFRGVYKYLEDLVSRIDAPRLYLLSTTFCDYIDFDTPELSQFISRTPTFGGYDEACLIFGDEVLVRLQSHSAPSDHGLVEVKILCQGSDWQFSSLVQIYTLSLPLLLTTEDLCIYENQYLLFDWKDDIENSEWLDLLLPFTTVKNLYLSKRIAPRIASALQELTGGRATEVLPVLRNLLLDGFQRSEPVQEAIRQFISARYPTNYPILISSWDRDSG